MGNSETLDRDEREVSCLRMEHKGAEGEITGTVSVAAFHVTCQSFQSF